MKFPPRHLLFGLCLTLVGAGPQHEGSAPDRNESSLALAAPALAVEEDGRLSLEAAGRRFEFAAGQVAVSIGVRSWTYRFQGSRGGIRALSISSMPEQTAPGSLEYRHAGGIVERYLARSRGVEQQFLLPGPYSGGDVLLTGSVETDLVAEVTTGFEGISFRREDSGVLFYGGAKAVDAAGKAAKLEERWANGDLTIVVPASFLASARFPVLIDPWIGGLNTVDDAVDLAEHPAIAADNGFQALVVWSTDANPALPRSIRGRIIDQRGNTVIGPISVVDDFAGTGNYYRNPRVAWSFAASAWVVAANGSPNGPLAPFIQVNKVDTAGTKTTGKDLDGVPGLQGEGDVDVACSSSAQSDRCLITWLVDRDNNGTLDSVKGVFYAPSTNTFGSIFAIIDGAATRSHSRVASNGIDFYEVNTVGGTLIEGWSVKNDGTVNNVNPAQTSTATMENPEVSYNIELGKYLVVWDTGSFLRGSTLSSAAPPIPSGSDVLIAANTTRPELTSRRYMGWTLAAFNSGGGFPTVALIRPDLSAVFLGALDAAGGVVSLDVATLYRGLSIVVYEDSLGSATDHDIRAREFLAPALEYADFDNNGWASGFVWRPGTNAYFYYNGDLFFGGTTSVQFGTTGDIPVRMDFNGDAVPDLAVFRPSNGTWYIDTDRNGTVNSAFQFGAAGDIPVPGDYDGDGRTDLAVFRPSNGTWYIKYAVSLATTSVQFGASGDIPVPADYNGDFKTDLAVWRPSTGTWYVDTDRNGTVNLQAQFGTAGDIPVPGDYGPSTGAGYPDGRADFAVFRPSNGTWYVSRNRDGVVSLAVQFGANGDIPVGGLYETDNVNFNSPFAVFRPSSGTWFLDFDNNGTVDFNRQFGASGDIPMQQPSGQSRN